MPPAALDPFDCQSNLFLSPTLTIGNFLSHRKECKEIFLINENLPDIGRKTSSRAWILAFRNLSWFEAPFWGDSYKIDLQAIHKRILYSVSLLLQSSLVSMTANCSLETYNNSLRHVKRALLPYRWNILCLHSFRLRSCRQRLVPISTFCPFGLFFDLFLLRHDFEKAVSVRTKRGEDENLSVAQNYEGMFRSGILLWFWIFFNSKSAYYMSINDRLRHFSGVERCPKWPPAVFPGRVGG